MGTTLMNQNSNQEEINSRLKSGNACYHLVQNLLSSSLLSKNIKIMMYRTIILPVVSNGFETYNNKVRRPKVFENRVLRRILGTKREEVTGEWREVHHEELNDPYPSPTIIWMIKSRRLRWEGHVAHMGTEEVYTRFW